MSEVIVKSLRKQFGQAKEVVAVNDVDLTVDNGELLVLLGPSGCGKSTILRCLAGLEIPDRGHIALGPAVVFDKQRRLDVPPEKRDIGMVFQHYALWPHKTVRANVAYPLQARRRGRKARQNNADIDDALALVRCQELADRYPNELSGGQQQRVALARGLIARPSVLLLDEPLSNLDALLRIELRQEITNIHRKVNFTGVYVTHDQTEALSVATRVAVMKDGDIVQTGTPEDVYAFPATPYVASFLGSRNEFPLKRQGASWAAPFGDISWAERVLPAGANDATLMLRPEALRVAEPEDRSDGSRGIVLTRGEVTSASYVGSGYEYTARAGGSEIYAGGHIMRTRPFDVGDQVALLFDLSDAHFYSGGRRIATEKFMSGTNPLDTRKS